MNIRKYTAPSLQEAVENMKAELGENAIVLSTRVLEPDTKLGLAKRFEVQAVAERDDSKLKGLKERVKEAPQDIDAELSNLRHRIMQTYSPKAEEQRTAAPSASRLAPQPLKPQRTAPAAVVAETNPHLEKIEEELIEKDINPKVAKKILRQISGQAPFLRQADLEEYVVNIISSMIPVGGFGVKQKGRCKVVTLVGPTGVGKTTCIAKLAVISKILHKLDVGLITVDTYRLGAMDQLKIFSQVSNVDFAVAYDSEDVAKMLKKFKKKDIVFIDTAGRSPKNEKHLQENKDLLSEIKIDETLLVLSATNTTATMIQAAEKFAPFKYDGIIMTKLDEAASFGNLLNLTSRLNRPLKFITNGQTIPDDIIAADADFLANVIYTGSLS